MEQIHDIEIRAAYLWALEGDSEKVLAHVEYAKYYLLCITNRICLDNEAKKADASIDKPMKYWRDRLTGKVCGTDEKPGPEWTEISKAEHRQAVDG